MLLYDDGSTDDTCKIAKEFGATVISGLTNRGCSHGKNQLAKYANSDWLFFLDADDLLLPNFTKRAFEWIYKDAVPDMILMKYNYKDALTDQPLFTPEYDRLSLLKDPVQFMINNKIVNSCLINKVKFIKMDGFDQDADILFIEDRAFAVKAALDGLSFDVDVESSFVIRYYPQSMSAKRPGKWVEAALHLWEKTYKKVGNKYPAELCNQLYANAAWAAKFNEWGVVHKSVCLAKQIDHSRFPPGGYWFRKLFQIHPVYAYKIRKYLLSVLKPEYQRN